MDVGTARAEPDEALGDHREVRPELRLDPDLLASRQDEESVPPTLLGVERPAVHARGHHAEELAELVLGSEPLNLLRHRTSLAEENRRAPLDIRVYARILESCNRATA